MTTECFSKRVAFLVIALLVAMTSLAAGAKEPATTQAPRWSIGGPMPNLRIIVRDASGKALSKADFKIKESNGKKAMMWDPTWMFDAPPDAMYFNLLAVDKYGEKSTWTVLFKDKPIATGTFVDLGEGYIASAPKVLDSAWTVSNPEVSIAFGYVACDDPKKTYTVVYNVTDPDGKPFKCNTVVAPKSRDGEVYGWFPQDFTPKTSFRNGTYKWKMSVANNGPSSEGTMTVKLNKPEPGGIDMKMSVSTTKTY